jgi:hypothetical protein
VRKERKKERGSSHIIVIFHLGIPWGVIYNAPPLKYLNTFFSTFDINFIIFH